MEWTLAALTAAVVFLCPMAATAGDFRSDLARVDKTLTTNPSRASLAAREACRSRRDFAVRLFDMGYPNRAERRLAYCFDVLDIPDEAPSKVASGPSKEEVQARAHREFERAIALEPNVDAGRGIYRECAACHMPEGQGLDNGMVPQLAGQHRSVIIKQLADIRAGSRTNPLMAPYSSVSSLGNAQAVADVAGYIDTLKISVENGKGDGRDLGLGEQLYRANCVQCHGARGEGDDGRSIPRIQAQHYDYLVRQFEWIKEGQRRDADPAMVAQIQDFEPRQIEAVLDYVSRLEPTAARQAPSGSKNPDFAN